MTPRRLPKRRPGEGLCALSGRDHERHGHVAWQAALLIAIGSVIGGQIGAKVGRRTRPNVLRGLVVLVGIVAIVQIVRS